MESSPLFLVFCCLRGFIIFDFQGHKSYVPNMISGASQADIGVLVSIASIVSKFVVILSEVFCFHVVSMLNCVILSIFLGNFSPKRRIRNWL